MKCRTCKFFEVNQETLTPKGRIGLDTRGICRMPIPPAELILKFSLPFWVEIGGHRGVLPDSPNRLQGNDCPAWHIK